MTYLSRALAEQPGPDVLHDVLFQLGLVETRANGPASVTHLRENFASAELSLSAEQVATLDGIAAEASGAQ